MPVPWVWIAGCGARTFLALSCCAAASAVRAGDFVFGDGFDIDLGNAFYVSASGLDTNPGTRAAPFRQITQGILAASGDPVRHTVAVAAGSYENIQLANGVSVYGQFAEGSWLRAPDNLSVIDDAGQYANLHLRSVSASGIVAPTVFDGFVVYGGINAVAGRNSYGVYVADSNANLRISHNVIFAGRGGAGTSGTGGDGGGASADGAAYSSALDAFVATGSGLCNASNNRAASGGGALTCADLDDISGGNGGGNNCTPSLSTQNSTASSPASAGQAATGAAGGSAGTRGYDGSFNGSTCLLPNANGNLLPTSGGDGHDGDRGTDAPGVPGCAEPLGDVQASDWNSGSAASGGGGSDGAGGGGGGGGGGAACSGGTCTKDRLGGHGGGGGSGGCGGGGGHSGGSGGGAFAIFIVGGSAPVVAQNLLLRGDGGDGGSGGNGGVGSLGGLGAPGGQTGGLVCTGAGGRGGNGGHGGHGAGGGGGCGGSSFGIYTYGIGTPDYCASGNNVIVGGIAGSGGSGGLSLGNPGGNGQSGALAACSFH